MLKLRKIFSLGAAAVAAAGLLMASCIGYDGDAFVRFTWETNQQVNMDMVAVSYADVLDWYRDVYYDLDFDDESATDIPLYNGSSTLPDNMYSSTTGRSRRGEYFKIPAGRYTAICSGEDRYGYWDIVANYRITINEGTTSGDGDDKWFEVVFNVRGLADFFNDRPGSWDWNLEEYNNNTTRPYFSKSKHVATEQIVRSGGTMDVEYYVIRRPKKN